MFPYMIHPMKREFGITIWKTEDGFRFQASGILDNFLFADISKKSDGWEMDGSY